MLTVWLLPVYRGLTTALGPLSALALAWRARRGKEDQARLAERFGRASLVRPNGQLAWLHGASVGECLSLLPLIHRLTERNFQVLVTSGTVSSARILAQRLPKNSFHQYIPLDVPQFQRRFMDHWRPNLLLVAESEIWPNLICEGAQRHIPIALVNARLSQRSYNRWRRLPGFIEALLHKIDLCLAQSDDDAMRLMRLGAPRVQAVGNLKFDVDPPPVNEHELTALRAMIGQRPVWVAASTHPGEEEIIIAAHRRLARNYPMLLTIIAPRHAERGPAIAELAENAQTACALRSNRAPIEGRTQIYIVDTMGELGLFYRLSDIIFMGKSLIGGGGQNPIEPAKLQAALLHGPLVANFAEVYDNLDQARGSIKVQNGSELARALHALLESPALKQKIAQAAFACVTAQEGASDRIMNALDPYFAHLIVSRS